MNIPAKIWKVLNTPIVFKTITVPEKKSRGINIFDFLNNNGFGQVSAWQALRYYEQIAPVGTAVDIVTDEIPALQLSVFDKKDGSYSEDEDIIKFLEKPNAGVSGQEFFKNYPTYFMTTGEVFLMATGNPNRPPLEMFVVPPQFVNDNNGVDGFPESYTVNNGTISMTFKRKEVGRQMRYFDESGERELWHVKDFNPNASSTNHRGSSRMNAIFYEIEQHLEASRHNLSLLQKGGRVTGALVTDEVLNDDSFKRLQEQLDLFYAGSSNAGRIFLGEGGMKFQEMGKSNRDMDFRNLKRDDAVAIYNRLKVPLALVTPEQMTLSNMEVAKLSLYDNAVLPLCRRLLEELTLFIGPRFKLSTTESLSVDPESIPALQGRQNAELKQQAELNVLTDNEIRSKLGREELDGGNVLYKPATSVPVAFDAFTDDNLDKPKTREKFFQIMREQKDQHGKSRWTDKQITEFADNEGL